MSINRQVGYYGLGERLALDDPALDDRLLRLGIRASTTKQTVILLSALGGGTGSGASPHILLRVKALNPHSRNLVIAMMPAADEPDGAHFNAFCSLSRFIKTDRGPLADVLLLVDYDRLMKIRGVGTMGEELARESLLSHMVAALVGAITNGGSSEADPGYLAKMSSSMGVHAFTPCLAIGRSLEIFGGIENILESALSSPLAPVDKESSA
jgi:cell division GTPase FtsZ